MKIATLSIGDEIAFGEIIDTNAPYIANRLYDMGLKVRRHLAVGDAEEDITAAIRDLAATSEVVVATGGLGPTCDDITAMAAAKAAGRNLALHEQALAHLRDFLAERGLGVDPANEKQAMLPAEADILPNPTGSACGFHFQLNGCSFFFLPGVPKEMKRMIEESIIPMLKRYCPRAITIRVRTFRLFGLPEAQAGTLLEGLTSHDARVSVAFQVDFPEIRVKLRAEGDDDYQVARQLEEACRDTRERLRNYIFAEDDDTMDSTVATLLRTKGVTLSLAESCTGGLLARRITDIPGSSSYFLEGAVVYSNAAKTRLLGVSPTLLEEKGAVSAEVAMAMATGMRNLSGSDLSLAVTGVAGPGGGTPEKPVGTVFLALASHSTCLAKEFHFQGNRGEIRTITSFTALDWLRRHLLSL